MYGSVAKSETYRSRRALFNRIRNILLIIFVIISIVTIVVLATYKTTQAKEAVSLNKYYKTVVIKPDDTLWDIATEYKEGSGLDTNSFIDEIQNINGISSGDLISGMKLIVPYYAR